MPCRLKVMVPLSRGASFCFPPTLPTSRCDLWGGIGRPSWGEPSHPESIAGSGWLMGSGGSALAFGSVLIGMAGACGGVPAGHKKAHYSAIDVGFFAPSLSILVSRRRPRRRRRPRGLRLSRSSWAGSIPQCHGAQRLAAQFALQLAPCWPRAGGNSLQQ